MSNIVTVNTRLAGWYTMTVRRADGTIREELSFPNLITDYALDAIGNNISSTMSILYNYCAVGTGSTTPTVADTALVTQIGSRANVYSTGALTNSGSSPYYTEVTKTFRFDPGDSIAGTLTEVGVFSGSTGSNCFSRALIKDGGGTPTSLVILSDEYLDVTWTLRMYVGDETDTDTTVDISGTTYDIKIRAQNATSVNAWNPTGSMGSGYMVAVETNTPAAITSYPAGSSNYTTTEVYDSYSSGTYYRDCTYTFGLTQGNFATGIGCVLVGATGPSLCNWAVYFVTTKIPKDNTKILTLTVRFNWGRH